MEHAPQRRRTKPAVPPKRLRLPQGFVHIPFEERLAIEAFEERLEIEANECGFGPNVAEYRKLCGDAPDGLYSPDLALANDVEAAKLLAVALGKGDQDVWQSLLESPPQRWEPILRLIPREHLHFLFASMPPGGVRTQFLGSLSADMKQILKTAYHAANSDARLKNMREGGTAQKPRGEVDAITAALPPSHCYLRSYFAPLPASGSVPKHQTLRCTSFRLMALLMFGLRQFVPNAKFKSFLDIGSGIGFGLIWAAAFGATNCLGLEQNRHFVDLACEQRTFLLHRCPNMGANALAHRVLTIHGAIEKPPGCISKAVQKEPFFIWCWNSCFKDADKHHLLKFILEYVTLGSVLAVTVVLPLTEATKLHYLGAIWVPNDVPLAVGITTGLGCDTTLIHFYQVKGDLQTLTRQTRSQLQPLCADLLEGRVETSFTGGLLGLLFN